MPNSKPITRVKCLLVEDDPFSRELVLDLISENFNEVQVCGFADNIISAEKTIIKENPDLVLLDVELPDGNCFELLERLKDHAFQTIFITSHDNYALQAFKYSAIDYIMKPLDVETFVQAVRKVITRKEEQNSRIKMELLLKHLYGSTTEDLKIALPTTEGLHFVRIKDIIRCQAESNYTHVHLLNKEEIMISKSLKEFEELLPKNLFYRVHKSHLINISYLKKYVKHDGGYVVLEDDTNIAVALRKKEGLFGKVNKFRTTH